MKSSGAAARFHKDICDIAKKRTGSCRSRPFFYMFYKSQKSKISLLILPYKNNAYLKARQKYPNITFIVSNPCFEIWLLYHFTENPKAESSSQAVKEQMKKYVPGYNEAMDVYAQCDLEDKYAVAINRSEKKNSLYDGGRNSRGA